MQGKQKPTLEQAFARVLREVRQERGISQEQLGFDSGYHRTYVGMMERGLMNPSLKTILSVASALGIPAGDLVGRVETALGKGWRRETRSSRTSGSPKSSA